MSKRQDGLDRLDWIDRDVAAVGRALISNYRVDRAPSRTRERALVAAQGALFGGAGIGLAHVVANGAPAPGGVGAAVSHSGLSHSGLAHSGLAPALPQAAWQTGSATGIAPLTSGVGASGVGLGAAAGVVGAGVVGAGVVGAGVVGAGGAVASAWSLGAAGVAASTGAAGSIGGSLLGVAAVGNAAAGVATLGSGAVVAGTAAMASTAGAVAGAGTTAAAGALTGSIGAGTSASAVVSAAGASLFMGAAAIAKVAGIAALLVGGAYLGAQSGQVQSADDRGARDAVALGERAPGLAPKPDLPSTGGFRKGSSLEGTHERASDATRVASGGVDTDSPGAQYGETQGAVIAHADIEGLRRAGARVGHLDPHRLGLDGADRDGVDSQGARGHTGNGSRAAAGSSQVAGLGADDSSRGRGNAIRHDDAHRDVEEGSAQRAAKAGKSASDKHQRGRRETGAASTLKTGARGNPGDVDSTASAHQQAELAGRLGQELQLIQRARRQLRAHDLQAALTTLRMHRELYPNGDLLPEANRLRAQAQREMAADD